MWDRGAYRQLDLTPRAVYDADYLRERYSHEKSRALCRRRLQVLEAFVPRGRLIDYGCGIGTFVWAAREAGWDVHGYDLVPPFDRVPAGPWDVATFFDSLEHLADPAGVIESLRPRHVMISVPWCHYPDSPEWFLNFYHRRPGEHLYHFSEDGLKTFMRSVGYETRMISNFEDDFRPTHHPGLANILSGLFVLEP